MRQTQIAEGIYQFTTVRDAYVRQLNSVAIIIDRDVLVFDTNTRPSSARAAREVSPVVMPTSTRATAIA